MGAFRSSNPLLRGSPGAFPLVRGLWDWLSVDPFTNTVRVTIMNLRRKLGRPPLIETVVGVGYRL
jgi:DNA-binding response OmpR family regulator